MRPFTGESLFKNDDAARVAAGFQVGEGLRRFPDRVAPGNELVELELAAHVEAEHAREIDARDAGPEVAARKGLLLERQGHGAHRGRIARLRHADHHREPAAPDRPRSEEHTSELQSNSFTSYADFSLKK